MNRLLLSSNHVLVHTVPTAGPFTGSNSVVRTVAGSGFGSGAGSSASASFKLSSALLDSSCNDFAFVPVITASSAHTCFGFTEFLSGSRGLLHRRQVDRQCEFRVLRRNHGGDGLTG